MYFFNAKTFIHLCVAKVYKYLFESLFGISFIWLPVIFAPWCYSSLACTNQSVSDTHVSCWCSNPQHVFTLSFLHLCLLSLSHTLALSISPHLSSFSLPFCSYSLSFLSCVFTGRLTCFIFFPSHFSSSPFQFSSLLQRVFHYPPLAPSLSGECGGREEGSLERQRWKKRKNKHANK